MTPEGTIRAEEIKAALFPIIQGQANDSQILNRPLGMGLSLPTLFEEVAQHYLRRALDAAKHNKTKAAKLVGLGSHQTLSDWLKKYKVEIS